MTRQQFDAFVKEIETRYSGNRRLLQRRSLAWAAVGYAGFLAWIGAVTALAGIFVALGIFSGAGGLIFFIIAAIIFGLGGWSVARALWIRLPPPEGREVTKAEAPQLFACLEELRAKCGSVPFHSVLITTDFNAGVTHIPRLGWLGWPRHYLLIGLPLLDLLSEAEMTAVLAHEFAHLSKKYGWVGHWIYRLRLSWNFLFTEYLNRPEFEGEISSRVVLRKYVQWFWPYFNAHAFVLSRSNEYEADATAASITGPQPVADALARIRAYSQVVEEKFWPHLWQHAVRNSEPPANPFDQLAEFVRTHFQTPRPELLGTALRAITTNNDTHPCLRERLGSLGIVNGRSLEPALAALPASASASARFLGDSLESIRKDLSVLWKKDCLEAWKKRHDRGISLDHRLQSLDKSLGSRADADTLWAKARSLIDLQSEDAAAPLLREILALSPGHAEANLCLGRKLLADDDQEGVALVERALAEEKNLLYEGCSLLHDFYRRRGDAANVEAIRRRVDYHEEMLKASALEMQTVTAADKLIPHGLEAEQLATLLEKIRRCPEVSRVYLGRKELKVQKDQKLFLLCICARRSWHRLPNTDAEEQIVAALTLGSGLPGRALIFAASGPFKSLGKKLMKVPASLVFSAVTPPPVGS